ncbi:hypothetical protein K435DRAFT_855145 [Dendrothele bispora CBS 962.96]|uniref:Uncharacterized protein n=1 Tax=Dendrothele bispora (strain CBS 962.96) TaxID=1314807 RepID=A0A4S8MCK2_DENBC|nr:hypothetical protein K435DRAFT_855145 [Dendrothele bispora CBS 962.96]
MSEQSPTPSVTPFIPYGERRVRDGLYDAIIDMELAMGSDGLAQIEPHVDIPLGPTFLDNMAFLGPDKKPFQVQILGELSAGANVRPTGSHNAPKGELQPINDKSRVKWNWSLQCPDSAPDTIQRLFHNQVTTLHNAIDPDYDASLKTWVTRPLADEHPDQIHIGTEKIYTSLNSKGRRAPTVTSSVKMVKKPLFTMNNTDEPDSPSGSSTSTLSSEGSSQPSAATRKPGDLLPPSLLPGYGGGWFDHSDAARLVQLDIRDPDGELIHPRDWWKWIVEGSLVFATAEMHLYDIGGRKTYSLVMKSLQVLDRSDAVPVMPQQRIWVAQTQPEPAELSPPQLTQSPSKYSPGKVKISLNQRNARGKKRPASDEAESPPKSKTPVPPSTRRNGNNGKK